MTHDSPTEILADFLQEVVSKFGFQRLEGLTYSRREGDALGLLSFPCHRHSRRGQIRFGCNVGLRFESLEKFLRSEPVESSPTIAMPLHLLREEKKYTEWQFQGAADLERLKSTITADLEYNALPFLHRYSRLGEVRRRLECSSPAEWFSFAPESRVAVLAAIQFVEGDRTGAMKRLDDALGERETALPKKRLLIEAVRKRFAEGR